MQLAARRYRRWLIAGSAALALALFLAARVPAPRPPLGLFTSLPIWWSEADGVAGQLAAPHDSQSGSLSKPHWARRVLAQRRRVVLLDTLLKPDGLADLVMAQPRPLEPGENVALDGWVRRGGHLLLFADPMLTWESRFALGDRRRPQDTVLLSPILAHWGLELRFDPDQPEQARENTGTGQPPNRPVDLPVDLPGVLVAVRGGDAACRIDRAGLIAECRIGKGRALIVADSAVLEPSAQPGPQAQALRLLMDRAFAL